VTLAHYVICVFVVEKETCTREKENQLGIVQGRVESVSAVTTIFWSICVCYAEKKTYNRLTQDIICIIGYWQQKADKRHGNPPAGWEPLVVKDKFSRSQEDLLVVHCFSVHGGIMLFGSLLGEWVYRK